MDLKETKDRLLEFLQSIAVVAVEAQNHIGDSKDSLTDYLDLLEGDLQQCRKLVDSIV